ncbi:non-ribosomal peptide synthetase, partial [Lonsdalea britannica]|uniref:non-ribosomal peptide synthetase n=1 Tax=Lonsdalea britannica TaxID=1082704 RepID=UPI0026F00BE5
RVRLDVSSLDVTQSPDVASSWHFPILDFRQESAPLEKAKQWMETACNTPFDLEQGPLFSFALIQITSEYFLFYQCHHHIVMDGYSVSLFIQRVADRYAAFSVGTLVPDDVFVGLAQAQKIERDYEVSPRASHDREYWLKQLANCPDPVSVSGQQARCVKILRRQQYLPEQTHRLLRRVAEQRKAALPEVLISLVALYLHRITGQEDLLLGMPMTARVGKALRRYPGMVSNVLPLRLNVSPTTTLSSGLQQTKRAVFQVSRHQRYRYETLKADLGMAAGRETLFSTLINILPCHNDSLCFEGARARVHNLLLGPVDDLSITLFDRGESEGIELCLNANAALYHERELQWHLRRLSHFFTAAASEPDRPAGELALRDPEERALMQQWHSPPAPAPSSPLCLHELFEQQADTRPQAVAVSAEGRSLSYGELNRRANQLARELIEQGVQPDSRVAIALPRGSELIVAILAVLKAGAGYVPLDPGYPQARLQYMLKDSAPEVLLTCRSSLPSLGDLPPTLSQVVLDGDARPWTHYSDENIPAATLGLTPHHLAYIIYTSGSTGQPKGVMVEHRNVTRLLSSTQALFDFDHHDIWTLFHSYAFDFSVWEIWGALLHGGRLVVVPQSVTRSPQALYQLVCREGVTVLNQTPGVFRQLTAAQADSHETHALRYVIFGGEALDVAALAPWYQQNPEAETQLVNMYGITETTVHVTHCPLSAGMPAGKSPIGKPLPDLRLYLLDSHGEPVPLGVTGELYVSGAGVTRGYLNQPALTEARFPLDPFCGESGARMYRTGDLGRWREDGTVEYLGRNDFQVKIRGFRIELGEIESALQACDGVKHAVVTAMSTKTQDKQLVAYYVAESRGQVLATDALKAQLGKDLPAFMVPAAYVALDAVPLTSNGKVDRRSLPAPDRDAFEHQEYEAPQGDTETTLAAIWRSVLGVAQVGRHDSFFALGGHSLLAVQLISRVRSELQRELPVAAVFESPVLHELAALLDLAPTGRLPDIVPVAEGIHPPLSLAQQRLWFLSRMDETARAAYVISFTIQIQGELDVAALTQALDRIVARHAALRTRIAERDGTPVQVIASEGSGFPLRRITADDPTASERGTEALAHGELTVVGPQSYRLRLSFHHLVADGWSVGIFLQELQSLYAAFRHGNGDPLPPLAIQFGDYAAWQQQHMRGDVLQAQQAYWAQQLRGIPDCLTLPSDRPRQAMQDYRGASVDIELDTSLTQALKSLSQHHGATLFMLLLAGWSALMSRLSGQEDVVIGSPVAGRDRQELEPLIGMFVNTLALRVDLSEQPDTLALLAQVKATTLAAQGHPDIPFEQVVEMLAPARSLAHSPVFQVMLALQNTPDIAFALPGLETSLLNEAVETAQFDLSLDLREVGGRIKGRLYYATALFDAATAQRYVDYWHALLRGMTADPHQPVQTLPLLPDAERRQLLFGFNATRADYPVGDALHLLFEGQADRQPDATAVECDGERLSYGELNRRANQLAHGLLEQGVRPNGRVAIVLERGCDLIIAMLATLKAGGGYVPIDPATPTERLAYLLEDSGPQAIITGHTLCSRLGERARDPRTLVIDGDARPWMHCPQENIPLAALGLTPRHLAYLIYTSGSTGRPKGVMVEHRNIINLVHWHCAAFALRPWDCVSSLAGLGFDAAAWEIWPALSVGARLLLPSPAISRDPDQLLTWWSAQPLDVSFLPTPVAELAFVREVAPATLRTLLVGGDRLNRQPYAGARFTLINNYGPTENTVVATSGEISADEALLHIGCPIANTQTYILDAQMQPVPVGVCGELYIGGAQVARGYLNRPELTAERFLPDPFSPEAHARLYRTGDLGRWRANGTIEFLGRSDFQVKIRGFRIELGEIEDALLHCDGIQQAVVVAQAATAQEKRL